MTTITVYSQTKLDDKTFKNIQAVAESHYGTSLQYQLELDPKIIAGVRLVAGDSVLDLTLEHQLELIGQSLAV